MSSRHVALFAGLISLGLVACGSDLKKLGDALGQGGAGGDDSWGGNGVTTGAGAGSSTSTGSNTTTSTGSNMCKPGGQACQAFSECCSGTCANQICTDCGGVGQSCGGPGGCCLGLDCYQGTCASCKLDGDACQLASDCCSNICYQGTCAACRSEGYSCSSSAECCAGTSCQNGICAVACSPLGGSCGSSADCCDGNSCTNGKCSPPCKNNGSGCSANAECCGGSCYQGLCQQAPSCKPAGSSCTLDSQCCSPNSCVNGSCGQPSSVGTCCTAQNTPGCSNAAIQSCVCGSDPYCCNQDPQNPGVGKWDSQCVSEVAACGYTCP